MIRKYRTGTLVAIRAIQRLIAICNQLPSPPSRGNPPRNFCPRCESHNIATAAPWTCGDCGWDNTIAITRTICRRIRRIRKRKTGDYAIAIEGLDAQSTRLTIAQRIAAANAIAGAVDLDDTADMDPDEVDDE